MRLASRLVIEPVQGNQVQLLLVQTINGRPSPPIHIATGPRPDIEAFASGDIDWETLSQRVEH